MAQELPIVTAAFPSTLESDVNNAEETLSTSDIVHYSCLGVITLLSLFGNGLTIAAVLKFPALQTPSNYVIMGLAVSDLLQPVGYILDAVTRAFRPKVCSIFYDVLGDFFSAIPLVCSFLHLLLIAVDRFIAVMYPLRYQAIFTMKVARSSMIITWAIAIGFSLAYFVWAVTYSGPYSCGDYETEFLQQLSVRGITYLMVAVGMVILYAKLALVARKHRQQIQDTRTSEVVKRSSLHAFILSAYILTWTPFIIVKSATGEVDHGEAFDIFTTICFELGLANCCVNAFLYAWRCTAFYEAYRRLLLPRNSMIAPSIIRVQTERQE